MKKSVMLAAVCLLAGAGMVGCTKTTSTATSTATSTTSTAASTSTSEKIDVAMITDVGNIDDGSFNQFTYEGVKAYCSANGKAYSYFRPSTDSKEARKDAMKSAIDKGAKVVVCPGYLFEDAIYEMQDTYSTVNFLLLDGEPHTTDYATYKTASNTHNMLYKENEAGYLAGYAAIMDGYTNVGFLGGMEVPAVNKYGFGYLAGIADAAIIKKVNVDVTYDYTGNFAASDANKTQAASMYTGGNKVIFSCGGSVFKSVVAAAEADDSYKVIGVDVDQYSQATDKVITSAEKKLKESTVDALTKFYKNNGAWTADLAGKTALLGAAEGMVGLPTATDSWKLKTFTVADYNTLFAKLAGDANYTRVSYSKINDTDKSATVHFTTALDLGGYVKITYGDKATNKATVTNARA
jgi:basic membrane protein A